MMSLSEAIAANLMLQIFSILTLLIGMCFFLSFIPGFVDDEDRKDLSGIRIFLAIILLGSIRGVV